MLPKFTDLTPIDTTPNQSPRLLYPTAVPQIMQTPVSNNKRSPNRTQMITRSPARSPSQSRSARTPLQTNTTSLLQPAKSLPAIQSMQSALPDQLTRTVPIAFCVVNEQFKFSICINSLAKLIKVGVGEVKHIHCPGPIEASHITHLMSVLVGTVVRPNINIQSHADVWHILRLADVMGVKNTICTKLCNWTQSAGWIEMTNPGYLYLIYTRARNMVDFNKFFRQHPHPMSIISEAVIIPELRAAPEQFLQMLQFFGNFDFGTCFVGQDDEIQRKVDELKAARNRIWKLFLVDPHQEFLADYFKYTPPTNEQYWSSDGIAISKRPALGDHVIASSDIAHKQLAQFTLSILDKPLNERVRCSFPVDNVIIAGGAAMRTLSADYNPKTSRQSDVDLFIFADTFEDRQRIFSEVINWFDTYYPNDPDAPVRTFYSVIGSVTNIYVRDYPRTFQIISTNCSTPFGVINHFDMTHLQWCVWRGQYFGTAAACMALRTRMTQWHNMSRMKIPRLIKALHTGYHISQDIAHVLPTIAVPASLEIDGLLSDLHSQKMQKILRSFYSWYYPKTEPEMESSEEIQHILAQIECQFGSAVVTIQPNCVLENAVISGNFVQDYESTQYNSFDPTLIVIERITRRSGHCIVKMAHTVVRITSPYMKIKCINLSESGIHIHVHVPEESFREFCSLLETQIYSASTGTTVTKSLCDEAGEMKFFVSKYVVDKQAESGRSCLLSQVGAALDIEEDLAEGDDIQIMFIIKLYKSTRERCVQLRPIRIIKRVKIDIAALNTLRDEIKKLDDEVEDNIRDVDLADFNANINYENVEY